MKVSVGISLFWLIKLCAITNVRGVNDSLRGHIGWGEEQKVNTPVWFVQFDRTPFNLSSTDLLSIVVCRICCRRTFPAFSKSCLALMSLLRTIRNKRMISDAM